MQEQHTEIEHHEIKHSPKQNHGDSTIITGNNEHTVPLLNSIQNITPTEEIVEYAHASAQTTYLEDEIEYIPQTIPLLTSAQNITRPTKTAYSENNVEYNQLSKPFLNNTQNIIFSKVEHSEHHKVSDIESIPQPTHSSAKFQTQQRISPRHRRRWF